MLSTSNPKELLNTGNEANRKIQISETYTLEEGYKAILHVETIYKRGSADEIRNYFKTTAKNQIQKSYLEYYTQLYPKTTKNEILRFEDDIRNNVFKVFESYKISEFGTLDNETGKRILPLYGNQVNNYIPNLEGSHIGPIALSYPMDLFHSIRIVNTNGVALKEVGTENYFNERSAYSYGKNIITVNYTLKINYQLSIHSSFVSENDVENFKLDFADKDNLIYNGYYLTEKGTLEMYGETSSASLLSYLITVFTILLALILIIQYYHKNSPKYFVFPMRSTEREHMSGWTVLLGIGVFISVIRLSFDFFGDDSLMNDYVWTAHTHFGINGLTYGAVIVFEIIGNVLLIVSFVYSLVLYFQKKRYNSSDHFICIYI